jgi:hypothetical protein
MTFKAAPALAEKPRGERFVVGIFFPPTFSLGYPYPTPSEQDFSITLERLFLDYANNIFTL